MTIYKKTVPNGDSMVKKAKQSKLTLILRVLLGIVLIVFGLNGIMTLMGNPLMPMPDFTGNAAVVMNGLFTAGYIFWAVALVNLLAGLAFVTNRYVALANVVLFPISLNLMLFHLFVDMQGIVMAAPVFIINVYLVYANWDKYKSVVAK
ncbi:MAG: putative oxidoreductase [Candidatus Woesearchaeota archaeon]